MKSGVMKFLHRRELGSAYREDKIFIREKMCLKSNLHCKDLKSHFGCVNAVEWSRCGSLLVSGGDDRRVLVWKVDRTLDETMRTKTVSMEAEHSSNIFCLSFDSENSRVYSGGNDDQVIVHDLATGRPLDYFRHEEPIYGLSVHPADNNLFLTACSDGRLLLFDTRAKSGVEPIMLAGFSHAFHSVAFNPVEPRLVVSANQKHGVGLWDLRRPRQCVMEYGNTGGYQQSSMYVRWNEVGDRMIGLRRRKPPVMYRINSPTAVCQFFDPCYYNSCTMKSCCFGGSDDEFVLSGSDDFNLYMWKVPPEGDTSSLVSGAHRILEGHRSIVNQVRYNHNRGLIVSSGVEKMVKLWSVLPLPDLVNRVEEEPIERKVYSHDEYIGLVLRTGTNISDYNNETTDENPRMMAFFDSLVQREIEGWDSSDNGTENDDVSEPDMSDTVVETQAELDSARYTRRERLLRPTSSSEPDDITDSANLVNDTLDTSLSTTFNSSSSSSTILTPQLDTSNSSSSLVSPSTSGMQSTETQTSPQTSQNRIAELIARKRVHLLKQTTRKTKMNEVLDQDMVNRRLLNAGNVIMSDSSSSHSADVDYDDLCPLDHHVSPVVARLRRKRLRLLNDQSDDSDYEEYTGTEAALSDSYNQETLEKSDTLEPASTHSQHQTQDINLPCSTPSLLAESPSCCSSLGQGCANVIRDNIDDDNPEVDVTNSEVVFKKSNYKSDKRNYRKRSDSDTIDDD